MMRQSDAVDSTTVHTIKLITGELIICSLEVFDDEHCVFLYPMELSVNQRGVLQIVKWIPTSSEVLFSLPIRSILLEPELVQSQRILEFYYEGVDKALWEVDGEYTESANTAEQIERELEAMEDYFFRSLRDNDSGANNIIQVH